jgi:hypothetical protein
MDDTTAPADFPELGLKKGDSVKRFNIMRAEVFESVVVSDIVIEVEGQPPRLVWRESIAWDPATKSIRSTAIGYTKELKWRYVYAQGKWTSDGKTLSASYTGVMGDGNKTAWKAVFSAIGEDRLSVKVTDRVRAGQRLDDGSREYERVK